MLLEILVIVILELLLLLFGHVAWRHGPRSAAGDAWRLWWHCIDVFRGFRDIAGVDTVFVPWCFGSVEAGLR